MPDKYDEAFDKAYSSFLERFPALSENITTDIAKYFYNHGYASAQLEEIASLKSNIESSIKEIEKLKSEFIEEYIPKRCDWCDADFEVPANTQHSFDLDDKREFCSTVCFDAANLNKSLQSTDWPELIMEKGN